VDERCHCRPGLDPYLYDETTNIRGGESRGRFGRRCTPPPLCNLPCTMTRDPFTRHAREQPAGRCTAPNSCACSMPTMTIAASSRIVVFDGEGRFATALLRPRGGALRLCAPSRWRHPCPLAHGLRARGRTARGSSFPDLGFHRVLRPVGADLSCSIASDRLVALLALRKAATTRECRLNVQ
jgi:hypothetical protein